LFFFWNIFVETHWMCLKSILKMRHTQCVSTKMYECIKNKPRFLCKWNFCFIKKFLNRCMLFIRPIMYLA